MQVAVIRVSIPAMSTVGYGTGLVLEDGIETGYTAEFVGDHRPMRHLGEALGEALEPIEVELDDWQVLAVLPL